MTKIKLFCLPYAGGSAVMYNKWEPFLNSKIQLCPIELAGRGGRMSEPLYKSLDDAVNDVFHKVKEEIQNHDYAFFGHSMGALITYRLLNKIESEQIKKPLHAFFSGREAPTIKPLQTVDYYAMNDDEFKKAVIDLGGTPPSFFDYPELLEVFLPFLRNDFILAETLTYKDKLCAYDFDITAMFGEEEDLTEDERMGWKTLTKKNFALHYFSGGHFFLQDQFKEIIDIINTSLARSMNVQILS